MLLLWDCASLEKESKTVKYTVLKGSHYSTPRIPSFLSSDILVFQAKFDSTAIYLSDGDLNKLYGFSDCNSTVHENSARIAWRWWNGELEFWSYTYAKGVRSYHLLTIGQIGQWNTFTISIEGDKYKFCGNGYCNEEVRYKKCNVGVYFMSLPYWGGDLPAPHDWVVEIR